MAVDTWLGFVCAYESPSCKNGNVTSLTLGLQITSVVLFECVREKEPLHTEVYSPTSITNTLIKSVAWRYQGVSGSAFIYLLLSTRVLALDWHVDNCVTGTPKILMVHLFKAMLSKMKFKLCCTQPVQPRDPSDYGLAACERMLKIQARTIIIQAHKFQVQKDQKGWLKLPVCGLSHSFHRTSSQTKNSSFESPLFWMHKC